jgi:DNA-binding MarR family transcriptional regulator
MLGTLFLLNQRDNVGVTSLGEHLGVSSAAASQMLERLVDEGLIQRVEDPGDRRMKKISLTDKGCAVLKESIKARMLWIEELAANFTPEENQHITSALKMMIDKIGYVDPFRDNDESL